MRRWAATAAHGELWRKFGSYPYGETKSGTGADAPERTARRMLQKIQSNLLLTVKNSDGSDMDFSKATNILFGIRQQPSLYLEFPGVWVNGQLLVQIPFEDAMKLAVTATKVQLFWTDENGQKHATAASAISVEELIREAGYD